MMEKKMKSMARPGVTLPPNYMHGSGERKSLRIRGERAAKALNETAKDIPSNVLAV